MPIFERITDAFSAIYRSLFGNREAERARRAREEQQARQALLVRRKRTAPKRKPAGEAAATTMLNSRSNLRQPVQPAPILPRRRSSGSSYGLSQSDDDKSVVSVDSNFSGLGLLSESMPKRFLEKDEEDILERKYPGFNGLGYKNPINHQTPKTPKKPAAVTGAQRRNAAARKLRPDDFALEDSPDEKNGSSGFESPKPPEGSKGKVSPPKKR